MYCQSNVSQCASPHNPTAITAEEYFNPEFNLNGRDIGRPVELTSKVQKYDASMETRGINVHCIVLLAQNETLFVSFPHSVSLPPFQV